MTRSCIVTDNGEAGAVSLKAPQNCRSRGSTLSQEGYWGIIPRLLQASHASCFLRQDVALLSWFFNGRAWQCARISRRSIRCGLAMPSAVLPSSAMCGLDAARAATKLAERNP